MCAKKRQSCSNDVPKLTENQEFIPPSSPFELSQIVPAAKSKKRRGGRRKGLSDWGQPSEDAVREMARAYLEVQRRHWPEKIRQGVLPEPSPTNLDQMVAEFNRRFFDPDFLSDLEFPASENIGCCYSRFSSDNSNERSLAQQLRNALEKAASLTYFIPWSLVFADAAVTGTTAARRGYQMSKLAIAAERLPVKCLFIDEIGRASRDGIEALALGRSITEEHKKRLVGATDGFDSELALSKIMLSVFAMLQEWFIDQLRSKVERGQDDAFRRGSNTGLPAPGYRLAPMRDSRGQLIVDGKGESVMQEVIAELEAKVILRIFRWYADDLRSPEWIAKRLNRIKFRGKITWDGARVRQILRRYTYVGIKLFRMTRQKRDRITGAVTVIKRPRRSWKVQRRRDLQIIPYPLWKRTRTRLREVGDAYKSTLKTPGRRAVYPSSLFNPICDDCGFPMIRGRSGKYGCYVCHNGIHGKHNCKSKGYKSIEHVEQTVLGEVLARLGNPILPAEICELANRFLQDYASKPKTDTSDLDRQIQKQVRLRKSLIDLVGDDESEDMDQVRTRLKKINAKIHELRAEKSRADAANELPPSPITPEIVANELGDLRSLLYEDVTSASRIFNKLAGDVRISQIRNVGKRGWKWTAHFTMNLVPVLVEIQRKKNCPRTGIWEYLNTRGWTIQQKASVEIGRPTAAEGFVARVRQILALNPGAKVSVNAVAAALGTDWNTANTAVKLATGACIGRGLVPEVSRKARKCVEEYRNRRSELIEKVVALRDEKHYSFPRLSRELQIKEGRARRLYDLGRPDKVAQAVAEGKCPARGPYSHLGPEKYQAIRNRLIANEPVPAIAAAEGVSAGTVYREQKRLLGLRDCEK